MNRWIKYTASLVATVVIATSAIAQDQIDKSKNKDGKTEEIVIRKKGDKNEKITIVIDGDNITINGKPADNPGENTDVVVLKRDVNRATGAPQVRTFLRGGNSFNSNRPGFDSFRTAFANKAMLGVVTQKSVDGAKIISVTKESGADKAGLKKDDVITKIGDSKIEDPEDLIKVVRALKPNEKVGITYKRDGKENKTTATLGENKASSFSFDLNNEDFNFNIPEVTIPRVEGFNFSYNRRPKIGMQIQDVEEGKGVTIKDVDEDSPASKAGLKEGDIITQLNGKEVVGVDELRTGIKDVKEGDTIKVNYKRAGKTQAAEIKIPKRLKTADL